MGSRGWWWGRQHERQNEKKKVQWDQEEGIRTEKQKKTDKLDEKKKTKMKMEKTWKNVGRSKHVLRSSGISLESPASIVRYRQKKECISFVFYCYENLSIAVTLAPLVRFRWGFQQNVPLLNEDFKPIENWKYHVLDFWLIPLDCITYVQEDDKDEEVKTDNQLHAEVKGTCLKWKTSLFFQLI